MNKNNNRWLEEALTVAILSRIFKRLYLFTYVNLFSVGIVNAFPVNFSMKEILRNTHVSLLLISLLPVFQELKNSIHSRKQVTNLAILYSVSSQGPTISNVVSKISSFSLV